MVESADLEGVIRIAIWQTTRMPIDFGEQLTERSTLGQLVKMLSIAMSITFPSNQDQAALAPIMAELQAMAKVRNYVAHAYWRHGIKHNVPQSVGPKYEKDVRFLHARHWRADELQRVAARIGRVMEELIWFLEVHGVTPPPMPDRSLKRYQLPPEPKWKPRKGRIR